jgi:hypothetical protein
MPAGPPPAMQHRVWMASVIRKTHDHGRGEGVDQLELRHPPQKKGCLTQKINYANLEMALKHLIIVAIDNSEYRLLHL